MRDLLSDPARAALLIVTLAEELPAREASELAAQARTELALPLGPLIVNALPTDLLESPAVTEVMARIPAANGDDALDRTLRLAAGIRAHRRVAHQVLQTLARDPGLPIVPLPRVPTAELGPDLLAALTPPLAAALATRN
jgi:hypothetical protein